MSSILKALKKIEKSTSDPDLPPPSWPSPMKLRIEGHGNGSLMGMRPKVVFLGGIALTLLLGVVWASWQWYFRSHFRMDLTTSSGPLAAVSGKGPSTGNIEKTPPQTKNSVISSHPAPPPAREIKPVKPTGPHQPGELQPVQRSGPLAPGKKTGEQKEIQALTPQPEFPQPLSTDMVRKTDGLQEPPKNADKPAPAIETPPKMEGTRVPGSIASNENIKPLKEGRMLLQAVAWSSIPEKRMAVISNEVLKEGGIVQGLELIKINENGVLLKEKGQIWSLGFPK